VPSQPDLIALDADDTLWHNESMFSLTQAKAGVLNVGYVDAGPADGPAVVVGSKRIAGSADTRNWQRRMITNVFSTLLRVGFGLSVSDTHGVKAMRRSAVAPLARHCRNGGDLFDTELILRAERSGLRSAEIPVEVVEKRPARSSIRARIPRTVKGLLALRLALWRERLPGSKPAVM